MVDLMSDLFLFVRPLARAAYDYKAVMPEELGFARVTLFAITLQQWWKAEV